MSLTDFSQLTSPKQTCVCMETIRILQILHNDPDGSSDAENANEPHHFRGRLLDVPANHFCQNPLLSKIKVPSSVPPRVAPVMASTLMASHQLLNSDMHGLVGYLLLTIIQYPCFLECVRVSLHSACVRAPETTGSSYPLWKPVTTGYPDHPPPLAMSSVAARVAQFVAPLRS